MRLLAPPSLRRAAILSLLLLLAGVSRGAQTAAQFPSDWTNALGSLADKIAAVTKRGEILSLDVKNISSLSAADAEGLRQLLVTDLSRRNRRVGSASPGDTALQVTFSESVDSYVWVAKILGEDKENVVMVNVAAPNQRANLQEAPVTLHRKLIWAQDTRILDFGILGEGTAGGAAMLIVLDTDKLSFYNFYDNHWKLAREVSIERRGPTQRDIHGRLDLQAGKAELPHTQCAGDFQHAETVTCASVTATADSEFPRPPLATQGLSLEDYVVLAGSCGDGPLRLASGTGDWTEPDFIQAYAGKNLESLASPKIEFPGPVLELQRNDDGKWVRVVSRNLKTGWYEASIVSVSCGD